MRAGYNPDFRPFIWQEDGEPRGELADICRNLFEQAAIEVEFVALGLIESQTALLNGDIDALIGMAASPDREDKFLFSQPLIQTGGAWFVRQETTWPDDQELAGSDAGTLTVTTPERGPLLAQIKDLFPDLGLLACDNYTQALQMVMDGKVDAAALNLQVGAEMAEDRHPGAFRIPRTPFFRVALAIATTRDDPSGLIGKLHAVDKQRNPLLQ
jgi:ABC-type amino acid transport substrate-binding protein